MQLSVGELFAQTDQYVVPKSKVEKLSLGQYLPDITLNDQNKNVIALSSFSGKYVLIQFWASWCKPSRADNAILGSIYSNYKNKSFVTGSGFEIYSISLDDNESNWRKAINEDNAAQWYQVSELMGVNSNVARRLSVTAIPANILIDGDGKVIASQFKISELNNILETNLQK